MLEFASGTRKMQTQIALLEDEKFLTIKIINCRTVGKDLY